jgi:sterol desaturase/sphingolipid hydroxylase (fatty acid hydroxylase superfamily)
MISVLAFVGALVAGSLMEYFGHLLMHRRVILGKRHTEHHRTSQGQGFAGEFRDYLLALPVVGWIGFVYSVRAGIAWAAGSVLFGAFAAYSHQAQHQRPELIVWMRKPIHHLHHRHNSWHHNFGISLDIWDRVFGTYREFDWTPDPAAQPRSMRDFLAIRWL